MILECPKCERKYRVDDTEPLRRVRNFRCPKCSWYLRPAAGQTFRCSSCGRERRLKSIPTSDLCQSCAAKQRAAKNTPVSITDDIVVTTNVAKRFGIQAETDAWKAGSNIPKTEGEIVGERMSLSWWWFLISLATGYFIARAISDAREDTSLFWLVLFAWGFGLPSLLAAIGDHLKAGGNSSLRREEHRKQVIARTVELAEERKRKQEEDNLFLSSPEWAKLREQVIKEEGRVCAQCHRHIKNDSDVTVDHIRPRSKYPDSALKRENLRVLCRECNSRKRDRE